MSIASKMSLRQRTRDSASRIETIEQDLIKLVDGVNKVLSQFQTQLEAQREVAAAITEHIGTEVIRAVMEKRKMERDATAAETAKASVEELKAKGVLVPTEKIEAGSFIVGRELDAEGKVIHPGRVQVSFKDLKDPFKPQLLDQAVGFSVTTESGGKFEVQEVYNIVSVVPAPAEPATEDIGLALETPAEDLA